MQVDDSFCSLFSVLPAFLNSICFIVHHLLVPTAALSPLTRLPLPWNVRLPSDGLYLRLPSPGKGWWILLLFARKPNFNCWSVLQVRWWSWRETESPWTRSLRFSNVPWLLFRRSTTPDHLIKVIWSTVLSHILHIVQGFQTGDMDNAAKIFHVSQCDVREPFSLFSLSFRITMTINSYRFYAVLNVWI
jgi:hypothetical protein